MYRCHDPHPRPMPRRRLADSAAASMAINIARALAGILSTATEATAIVVSTAVEVTETFETGGKGGYLYAFVYFQDAQRLSSLVVNASSPLIVPTRL